MPDAWALFRDAQDEHGEVVARVAFPVLQGDVPQPLCDGRGAEASARAEEGTQPLLAEKGPVRAPSLHDAVGVEDNGVPRPEADLLDLEPGVGEDTEGPPRGREHL